MWRTLHLLSVPAAVAAGVHAWMVGSSRGQLWFPMLLTALVGVAVYPAALRLASTVAKRRTMRSRRDTASGIPPTSAAIGAIEPPPRPSPAAERDRELVGSGRR